MNSLCTFEMAIPGPECRDLVRIMSAEIEVG